MQEEITQHEANIDEDNPKDLIDDYLIAMRKEIKDPDTRFGKAGGKISCLSINIWE